VGKRKEDIADAQFAVEQREAMLHSLLEDRRLLNTEIASARTLLAQAQAHLEAVQSPEPDDDAIQFDLKFEARGITYRYGGTRADGRWYLNGSKQVGRSYSWRELVDWIKSNSYFNTVKVTPLSPNGESKPITITK
jgi:hypothetical protein